MSQSGVLQLSIGEDIPDSRFSGDAFCGDVPLLNKPVILAGGLRVSNVAEAISRVRPWAIDVSSGVEVNKGIKSVDLLSAFLQEVENADR